MLESFSNKNKQFILLNEELTNYKLEGIKAEHEWDDADHSVYYDVLKECKSDEIDSNKLVFILAIDNFSLPCEITKTPMLLSINTEKICLYRVLFDFPIKI